MLSNSAISQSWVESNVLGHPDAQKDDMYGYGMSQYEDILVVGAPDHEYDISGGNKIAKAGAVYVYHKSSDGSTWELSEKLISPDRVEDAQFGRAVCVYGDYLFVNSYETVNSSHYAGKIYIFLRLPHGKYYYVQTLVSRDPQYIENFGLVMAANSGYLFCGTKNDSDDKNGTNTMPYAVSVTVFKLSSTDSWEFNQKIVPDDRASNMNFGNAVAVTSGGVLIGAQNYTMTTGDETSTVGKVYYYEYDRLGLPHHGNWNLQL
ncbi:MAG: hypothetical protein HOK84_02360 [Bacteroidetes bacterium]|nr:hypothetical protein [Bacteroidota bacterium]